MSFTEPPFTTYLLEHLTQRERDVMSPILLGEGEITTILPGQGIFVEQDPRTIVVKLLEIDRGALTTDQRDIIHKAMDHFARLVSPDRALQQLEDGRNAPPSPNVLQLFLNTQPPVMRGALETILAKPRLATGVERIAFEVLLAMIDAHAIADYLEKIWEHGLSVADKDLLQDLKDFVNHYLATPPMVAGATHPSTQGEPRPLHPLELPIGAKEFSVPYVGVFIHWITQDHEAMAAHFLAKREFVSAAQHLIAAANKRFKTHDFKIAANLALQAYLLFAIYQDSAPADYKNGHNLSMIETALLECHACLRTLQYERAHIILSEVNTRIREYKAAHNRSVKPFYDVIFERLQTFASALQGSLDEILASIKLNPNHYAAVYKFLHGQGPLSQLPNNAKERAAPPPPTPLPRGEGEGGGWPPFVTRRAAHALALAWRQESTGEPEKFLVKIIGSADPETLPAFPQSIALHADGPEDVEQWLPDVVRADLFDFLYRMQLAGGNANAAFNALLKKITALLQAHQTVAAMGAGEAALKLAVDSADSSDGKGPDFYQLVEIYQQALNDQTLDASYKDNLVVFIAALYDRWFIHLKKHGFNPVAMLVEQTQFLLDRGRWDMAGEILAKHLRATEDSAINLAPGSTSALPIVFSEIVDGIDSAYCPVPFLTKDGAVVSFFLGHPRFLKGVLQCLAMIFAKEDNRDRIPGSYYQKLADAVDDVTIPGRNELGNWNDEVQVGGVYEVDGLNHTLKRVVQESEELPLAIDILMRRGRELLMTDVRDPKRRASLSHDAAIAFNQAYFLGVQWGVDDTIIAQAAGSEAIAWNEAEIDEPALIATLDNLSRMGMASTVGQLLKTKLRETQPWRSQNLDIYNLLVSINDAIRYEGSQPSRRAIIGCCVLADAVLAQDAITELFHKLLEMHLSPKDFISSLKGYAPLAQNLNIGKRYRNAIATLADKIVYTSEDPEPEPSGPGGGRRTEPLTLRAVPNRPAASREKKPAGKRGEPDGGAAAILAGTRVITGGGPLISADPLVQSAAIMQEPVAAATPTAPENGLAPAGDADLIAPDDSLAPIHPGILQPARALNRGALRLVTTRG